MANTQKSSFWFDKPATDVMPRQPGGLSIIGRTLQGVAAPFAAAYGNNSGYEALKLQQQQDEANMEFQKYLMQNKALTLGKPIFTVGPDGSIISLGTVPKGSQVVANPTAPTADMKNAAVSAGQSSVLLEDLRTQAEGLKGGWQGIGELGKAEINRGYGASGDYKMYADQLPAAAVSFYRAVTGDTRLSDDDARKRALPMLWHPSEDDSLKAKKFNFAEKMLGAREKLLQGGKYKEGVIPFSVLRKTAETLQDTSPQTFDVGGKTYNIPADKIEAFKKAKGIK